MQLPQEIRSFPTLQLNVAHAALAEPSAIILPTHQSLRAWLLLNHQCRLLHGFLQAISSTLLLCPDQQPQPSFTSVPQILASPNYVPLYPSPLILVYSSSSVLSVPHAYLQIPLDLPTATSSLILPRLLNALWGRLKVSAGLPLPLKLASFHSLSGMERCQTSLSSSVFSSQTHPILDFLQKSQINSWNLKRRMPSLQDKLWFLLKDPGKCHSLEKKCINMRGLHQVKESASSSICSDREFFQMMIGLKKVLNGTDTMQYTNYLTVHNIFI